MPRLLLLTALLTGAIASGCGGVRSSEPSGGVVYNPITADVADSVLVLRLERSVAIAFPASYEAMAGWPDWGRFTPDSSLVARLEGELQRQYVEAWDRYARLQVGERAPEVYGRRLSAAEQATHLTDLRRSFARDGQRLPQMYKQYLGFVSPAGERVVLVQLLNFDRDPHRLRETVAQQWVEGWHGWFETNVRHLEYDVARGRLNVHGWGHL
jgi:hypothetical protein